MHSSSPTWSAWSQMRKEVLVRNPKNALWSRFLKEKFLSTRRARLPSKAYPQFRHQTKVIPFKPRAQCCVCVQSPDLCGTARATGGSCFSKPSKGLNMTLAYWKICPSTSEGAEPLKTYPLGSCGTLLLQLLDLEVLGGSSCYADSLSLWNSFRTGYRIL